MTNNINKNKKAIFKKIFSINYLVQFYNNNVWVFFNNKNKINIMSSNYIQKLSFKIQKISIKIRKIKSFTLKNFEIVIIYFQIEDKIGKYK